MRQFKAMKKKIPGGWWVIHDPSGTEIPRASEEPSVGGGGRYGYFLESHIKVIKVNFAKNDECAKNSSRVWPNIQMR